MNILNHFKNLTLTKDQQMALDKLGEFFRSDNDVFILKGYAGSGKTTLIKGIVSYLKEAETNYQLMAPTGRAAKVINQKTGIGASTIHKGIYSFDELLETKTDNKEEGTSFIYSFAIRNNLDVYNSVLIFDEASMVSNISNKGEFFQFGTGHLLNDIITYSGIKSPNNKTKIIFVGDPAQLPPIGMNFSPALDEEFLNGTISLTTASAEMKEVKRHDQDNGILKAASNIRRSLTSGYFNDFNLRDNGKDIANPPIGEFLNSYKDCNYTKIIITYKNKTALDINQNIRRDKFGKEIHIQESDIIIIGHNNYRLDIMNGEFGLVANTQDTTVSRSIALYLKGGEKKIVTLTWRWVKLVFDDMDNQSKIVKGYMLENYLYGDNYLKSEEQQALYVDFKQRHKNLKPKTEEFKDAIYNDPFFNCIQLKFGYAVTCHKSQGGEWDTAFVFWDKGVHDGFNFYESDHERSGKTNPDFYRWAYTAVTRAAKKLNCINPPYFSSFSNITFISLSVQDSYKQLTAKDIIPVSFDVDDKLNNLLSQFGLADSVAPLQDHFLKIHYLTQMRYIDIIGWKKVNYEIWYYFKREGETAAIKFWINGKNAFKPNFIKLPVGTNSDGLYDEISQVLVNMPPFVIQRKTAESILPKIELDISIEEERPFLKNLLDDLTTCCLSKSINISSVEHHEWRERYCLKRVGEIAVIDFEYDKGGFFGRVLPLTNKCNSVKLIEDLRLIFENLKKPEYVI